MGFTPLDEVRLRASRQGLQWQTPTEQPCAA